MCTIDYGSRVLRIGSGGLIILTGSYKSLDEILDTRLKKN